MDDGKGKRCTLTDTDTDSVTAQTRSATCVRICDAGLLLSPQQRKRGRGKVGLFVYAEIDGFLGFYSGWGESGKWIDRLHA
jgi:hypothetical protein